LECASRARAFGVRKPSLAPKAEARLQQTKVWAALHTQRLNGSSIKCACFLFPNLVFLTELKMWEDPIVAEVRKHRKKIEEDCDRDFDKLFEQAMLIQKEYAKKLVSRPAAKQKQTVS
jgi:hypothetical protein